MENKDEVISKVLGIKFKVDTKTILKFKDFDLKIVFGENEFDDTHPRYTTDITFLNNNYFKELSISEWSDCYYCNEDAEEEMMKEIVRELGEKLDMFYNPIREIKKDIEVNQKEMDRRENIIKNLKNELERFAKHEGADVE